MPKNSFYFQWHITDFCGNRCLHCYVNEFDKNRVSLKKARDILADMKECCDQLDAETILSITGGDPLTHPDIWIILKEAKKFVKKLGVLGNPELINERSVEKLQEVGIYKYQFSIDGMKDTHDKFRSAGSFKRTTEAIKLLISTGISVVVNSTVSSMNYHEMVDVMKLCCDLGVSKWSFARWVPESGTCGISALDYREFHKNISIAYKAYASDGKTFLSGDSLMNSALSKPTICDNIVGGCSMGGSVLCILPNNNVMACRRHKDSVLGKWKKQGDFLDFFLFNPKMQRYREIENIQGCKDCSFKFQCRGCRALALAASGNALGYDPQCIYHQH